jgi:hypothetical protein
MAAATNAAAWTGQASAQINRHDQHHGGHSESFEPDTSTER